MKVVILAAGKGVRFGGRDLPKALTKLASGQSILSLQLERISKVCPLNDVIVVVGYHKKSILQAFPQLSFVENPHYAEENTAKSLWRALESIDDDLLWINGDVVFNEGILSRLLEMNMTAMVVNRAEVGEEEVKYHADENGSITAVSKQILDGQGEAVGINFFKQPDIAALKEHLLKCSKTDYFEKAVEGCITEGINVKTVFIDVDDCIEIDFPTDLEKANRLLATWRKTRLAP